MIWSELSATCGGALTALPLQIFTHLFDSTGKMPLGPAMAFRQRLANRAWARSALLREALARCHDGYAGLWRQYTRQEIPADLAAIATALEVIAAELGAEMAAVRDDLMTFARRLYKPWERVPPGLARLLVVIEHGFVPARVIEGDVLGALTRQAQEVARDDGPVAPTPPPRRALPGLPPPGHAWSAGPIVLSCLQVRDEGREVRTFTFAADDGRWFRFLPGQFITLELTIDGRRVPRSYSMSSSPTRPATLELTVKRFAGGVASSWLHENVVPGTRVLGRGPAGGFSCLEHRANRLLFLTAGSGITPAMSMVRYLVDLRADVDALLFQSASTAADVLFGDELAFAARLHPGLAVRTALTRDPAPPAPYLRGRLDRDMLLRVAPDVLEREVFCCGPAGFMALARRLLQDLGFPMGRYHEESFTPHAAPRRAPVAAPPAGTVTFLRSNHVRALDGGTVLELAEAAGIPIPCSCRTGACGSCRVQKLAGRVEMAGASALTSVEIDEGLILACIARPEGSVEIDL
jgi:ferredoxin-NADP reductase